MHEGIYSIKIAVTYFNEPSLVMFLYLLTWTFEHLLAGWVVLEDHIFDPIAHQCKQCIERFRYGERVTI